MPLHNLSTKWRHTLARNPTAWYAHFGLGLALQEMGRYQEAKRHYAEVIRLKPFYYEDAYHNLRGALARKSGPLTLAGLPEEDPMV